jgi:hypothetical protein
MTQDPAGFEGDHDTESQCARPCDPALSVASRRGPTP